MNFRKNLILRIIQDFCNAFRERESRKDWTNVDVLIDRHLIRRDGKGKLVPLNSLVLMAARDPRRTIPGCRVSDSALCHHGGGDWRGIFSRSTHRFIEGNLVKIIGEASETISDLIYDVTWLNKDGKFVTTPEYPEWAWFEAVVNACVHRSYSYSGSEISVKLFPDRIEIESPGGFVPPVNEKTIYEMRLTRNYHLMDVSPVSRICPNGSGRDETNPRKHERCRMTGAGIPTRSVAWCCGARHSYE